MGKREKKIEVIRKYINQVGGTSWPGYAYEKIPKSLASNARYAYAGAIQTQDILGLVDITITGNGKKGIVFTEYKAYYDNGFLENRGSVSYQEIYESGKIPGGILGTSYNKQALIELLSKLADIEGANLGGTVNETLDSLTQGVQTVTDTIGKVARLFNSVVTVFDSLEGDEEDGENERNPEDEESV